MEVHQYTWLFALGIIFAFLDAFGIGANDVANSFATSVGSRSLTLKQACIIAVFTEFGGAVLMGAETTDTVKGKIINISSFQNQPDLLMLGFVCALVGSSFWVLTASRYGWPVSTTHSIIGAVIGFGIAAFGTSVVDWSWNGVGKIIASWFISPAVAGLVSSIVFLATKYGVMKHANSFKRGLIAIPIYFTVTIAICVLYVVVKGGKSVKLTSSNTGVILGSTFGAAAFVGLFCVFFFIPWLKRKLQGEEKLSWYHVFYIWWVPKQPRDEELHKMLSIFSDHTRKDLVDEENQIGTITADSETSAEDLIKKDKVVEEKKTKAQNVWSTIKYYLLRGVNMDVATVQSREVADIHALAQKYENKTEYMYSFLQVITASFASFAHGSNDVANAIGPLSAIYYIWENASIGGATTLVPIWCLAFGGLAIDLGLLLYGYNVMKNLGNNITFHSPSRGFSMELGAALTVLTASFLGLPVSTTHCITGSTAAVGLCNGEVKSLNWKVLAWCLFSWILTLPVAGTISGVLFAMLSHAPKFQ